MIFNIITASEAGVDLLTHCEEHEVLALEYFKWATANLPGTTRMETFADRRAVNRNLDDTRHVVYKMDHPDASVREAA